VPFWIHIRFRDAFFQLSHRKFAGGVALRRFQSLISHLFPYSGLKKLPCLICSNGPAEIIALPLVASVTLEELQLLSGFNAFCDYALLQTFADIDHGAYDGCIFRASRNVLHERLMQFERIRWKT